MPCNPAPEKVLWAYSNVLREAILNVRMRIRYGETLSMDELHDLTDALENLPQMLCAYGGWYVEANMDWSLQRYDEKWYRPETNQRSLSLMQALASARAELNEPGQEGL